jgi:hypothetical protein
MPAIQPARLKIQSVQLAERFTDPAIFKIELREMLDFYADRVYRPGQAGDPPPLLKAYNVPTPVLRQISQEIARVISTNREAALELGDALWSEPMLEFHLLAVMILGQISVQPLEDILRRVNAWAMPSTEGRLIRALIDDGLISVRSTRPDQYIHQVEIWLSADQTFYRQLGLQALVPLLEMDEFENLPVVMRLITPLVRAAPPGLRPDLLAVIKLMATRSPKETAYFLRQNLVIKDENPGTAWLARQSLVSFPAETRTMLRAALRENI